MGHSDDADDNHDDDDDNHDDDVDADDDAGDRICSATEKYSYIASIRFGGRKRNELYGSHELNASGCSLMNFRLSRLLYAAYL